MALITYVHINLYMHTYTHTHIRTPMLVHAGHVNNNMGQRQTENSPCFDISFYLVLLRLFVCLFGQLDGECCQCQMHAVNDLIALLWLMAATWLHTHNNNNNS